MIKAARVQSLADIQALAAYHTDFHLYDSYKAGVPGGTGETFAWELAAGRGRVAPPRRKGQRVPLILSGGLTPENVGGRRSRSSSPWPSMSPAGSSRLRATRTHERMRAFARGRRGDGDGGRSRPTSADGRNG